MLGFFRAAAALGESWHQIGREIQDFAGLVGGFDAGADFTDTIFAPNVVTIQLPSRSKEQNRYTRRQAVEIHMLRIFMGPIADQYNEVDFMERLLTPESDTQLNESTPISSSSPARTETPF
jgi:hypothetical protein